jgi:hypothetical protein
VREDEPLASWYAVVFRLINFPPNNFISGTIDGCKTISLSLNNIMSGMHRLIDYSISVKLVSPSLDVSRFKLYCKTIFVQICKTF